MKSFYTLIFSLTMAASASAQTLISHFQFDNNLNDAIGNANAVLFNDSGVVYTNGALSFNSKAFGKPTGIKVRLADQLFTEDNYTIAIDFEYNIVSGYRKVIDFTNLTEDQGLYIFNGQTRLYPSGSIGDITYEPNERMRLIMFRSKNADSAYTAFNINKSLLIQSEDKDTLKRYVNVLDGTDRVIHFFSDDSVTVAEQAEKITVYDIRIWNGMANFEEIVSTQTQKNSSEITIYPNPTSGAESMTIAQPLNNAVLTVLNTLGQVVYNEKLTNSGFINMPIKYLENGMYVLQVSDGVSFFTKKFIKN